jgi:hypothetical protein
MSSFGAKALDVLKTVAPTLATALGGPLAGAATGILIGKLGGGDAKAAETAIASADPETLVKLQQIDADFKAKMEELGVQEEQLAYADTASAREREMAVKDWAPQILGYTVVALTLILEGAILMGWNGGSKVTGEVIGRILGTLDSATLLVLSYYFGSSVGARRSAAALADIAKQP